jgi:hypothetical protein
LIESELSKTITDSSITGFAEEYGKKQKKMQELTVSLQQAKDNHARACKKREDAILSLGDLTTKMSNINSTIPKEIPCWVFFFQPNPNYIKAVEKITVEQANAQKILHSCKLDIDKYNQQIIDHSDLLAITKNRINSLSSILSQKKSSLSQHEQAHQVEWQGNLDQLNKKYKQDKATLKDKVQKKLESIRKSLVKTCTAIRSTQPRLSKISLTTGKTPPSVPDFMVIGENNLECQEFSVSVPSLIKFPFQKPIFIPGAAPEAPILVHRILLRMLLACTTGKLEVIACDPRGLGTNMSQFANLIALKKPFILQKFLSTAGEIDKMLEEEFARVENIIQVALSSKYKNIVNYNLKNSNKQIAYRCLIFFDFPDQCSEKSLVLINSLISQGPTCGFMPIFIVNSQDITGDKRQKYIDGWIKNAFAFDKNLQCSEITPTLLPIRDTFFPEQLSDEDIKTLVGNLAVALKESEEFWPGIELLLPNDQEYWKSKSIDNITAAIGWDKDRNSVNFSIGEGIAQHAIVAGSTGSGKSNLMHVLIASLAYRYSPYELRLFLLDFKQSVETAIYGNPALPHAYLVAVESDREYGKHVLDFLIKECDERSRLFKDAGVNNYSEYRIKTEKILPRYLIIIDEFQVMFEKDDAIASTCSDQLDKLARQGRAFGIHLFLLTQTFAGMQQYIRALVSQLGVRIALSCDETDSRQILDNPDAKDIKNIGEAIYNSHGGSREHNQHIAIPYITTEKRKDFIIRLNETATKRRIPFSPIIFDGQKSPSMDANHIFPASSDTTIALNLGERLGLNGFMNIKMSQQNGNNILLLGRQSPQLLGILGGCCRSLASQKGSSLFLVDSSRQPASSHLMGALQPYFAGCNVSTYDNSDIEKAFDSLLGLIGNDEHKVAPAVLIINDLALCKQLHKTGAYGKPTDESLFQKFATILSDGPAANVFCISVFDSWKRLNTSMDTKVLAQNSELRIALTLPDDLTFLNNVTLKSLTSKQAVYCNNSSGDWEIFRPFSIE